MKKNRLIALSLVAISYVFLCGFSGSDNHKPTLKNDKHVKEKRALVKDDETGGSSKNQTEDEINLQKPLDLSVPMSDQAPPEQWEANDPLNNTVTNLFAPQPKKPSSPLQFKGDLLMSVEPQTEKKHSVEGAGIVIDLKH